jgi:hypothetical protein
MIRRSLGCAGAVVLLLAATWMWLPAGPAAAQRSCDDSALPPDRPVSFATHPPVEGFRFVAGGTPATTGPDGTVTLEGVARCDLADRLVVDEADRVVQTDATTRVRFARWFGSVGSGFTAAFNVEKSGSWRFLDGLDRAYPPSGIDLLRVRSSTGSIENLDPEATSWFTASRVIQTSEGLVTKDVYHTVDTVLVGEASVVNRSQYKWFPSLEPPPVVSLLFFTAEITVRDALFGRPVGRSVTLVDSAGAEQVVPLDGSSQATVHNLPRGDYEFTVDGPGLKISRPVSITRDQVVDLKLFTWVDIGVLVTAPLVVAVALLALGRRRHRRRQPLRLAPDHVAPGPETATRPPNRRPVPDRRRCSTGRAAPGRERRSWWGVRCWPPWWPGSGHRRPLGLRPPRPSRRARRRPSRCSPAPRRSSRTTTSGSRQRPGTGPRPTTRWLAATRATTAP